METKRKIMDSAFNLFANQGSDFSLSEIANEVLIKKSSIYAHFESKQALLYKVIEKEINCYFFELENYTNQVVISSESLYNELKEIFFKILNYYNSKEKLLFWKRLLLFPPAEFQDTLISKIHNLSEERYQVIKDLFSYGIKNNIIKDQSLESIVLSYFSLIHGSLSSTLIYSIENIKEEYNFMWENFWDGIRV